MLSERAFRSRSRESKETRSFVSSSLLHQHVRDVQTLCYDYPGRPFSINPAEQEERRKKLGAFTLKPLSAILNLLPLPILAEDSDEAL